MGCRIGEVGWVRSFLSLEIVGIKEGRRRLENEKLEELLVVCL